MKDLGKEGLVREMAVSVQRAKSAHVFAEIIDEAIEQLAISRVPFQKALWRTGNHRLCLGILT